MSERKAVISLMLHHDKGILSEVLNTMSKVNANLSLSIKILLWTVGQVLSFLLIYVRWKNQFDELLAMLEQCRGVSNLRLVAV